MTQDEFKEKLAKSPAFNSLDESMQMLILESQGNQMDKFIEHFKIEDQRFTESYNKFKGAVENGLKEVKQAAKKEKKHQLKVAEEGAKAEEEKMSEELLKTL
ncbi:MAG: hypothetical protein OEY44_01595 [Candidatus Peregrinibacteria bacterium]|nr:hypothetical protein [Candidatus Peregrinibacteria bacterium]